MKDVIYLTVDESGVRKLNKKQPPCARHERVIRLFIEVPDDAFAPPVIAVSVEVPFDHVGIPSVHIASLEPADDQD